MPSRPRIGVASRPTTRIRMPGQGHRLLAEAEVGEPQRHPLARRCSHQRRVRLVLEVRAAGRGDQVAGGVADRVEAGRSSRSGASVSG